MVLFLPAKWEQDGFWGKQGLIPLLPSCSLERGVLHGLFYSPSPPPPPKRRERRRKECLRTIGLTPKLEAAKRSDAETLVEAVVWA